MLNQVQHDDGGMAGIGWKADIRYVIHQVMRLLLALALTALLQSGCSRAEQQACTAARSHWQKPTFGPGLHTLWDRVTLDHKGEIFWNGSKISNQEFERLLMASVKLEPRPDVYLEAEMGVPCRTLEAVRDQMEKALGCQSVGSTCLEGYPNFIPLPNGS
ncbi:ExbD/TolR family protein [Croceibacterium aestuarii]|uniref:ExbD/TolR family protein n=1 Tax=Croceibacterium aestuarii TaxID=3064139 RepID=UPI00272DCAFF|nr:hypothetical protein [Croceibacterium sp. D39]